MRAPLFARLALVFLCSLAAAAVEPERSIDIFAWPLSAIKSQSLARITYTTGNATIKAYTSPTFSHLSSNEADAEIVRVGFYHASGAWSGIATSASNFAATTSKTIQLHLRQDGELHHIGFKAGTPAISQGRIAREAPVAEEENVSVEVLPIPAGPVPYMNKPVVLSAEGTVEEKEPEKSFIQKYWWVMAIVLLVQIMGQSGGGGEDKSKK